MSGGVQLAWDEEYERGNAFDQGSGSEPPAQGQMERPAGACGSMASAMAAVDGLGLGRVLTGLHIHIPTRILRVRWGVMHIYTRCMMYLFSRRLCSAGGQLACWRSGGWMNGTWVSHTLATSRTPWLRRGGRMRHPSPRSYLRYFCTQQVQGYARDNPSMLDE